MSRAIMVGSVVFGMATALGLINHDHQVIFIDTRGNLLASLTADGYWVLKPDEIDLSECAAVFVSVAALTGSSGIDLLHLLATTSNLSEKVEQLARASGKKANVDFGAHKGACLPRGHPGTEGAPRRSGWTPPLLDSSQTRNQRVGASQDRP